MSDKSKKNGTGKELNKILHYYWSALTTGTGKLLSKVTILKLKSWRID